MKLCNDCGEEKPETEFYRDASRNDGLNWRCKPCHKVHLAKLNMQPPRNPAPEGMKRCQGCKETKPLDEFYGDKNQYDGKARQCKQCAYTRHRQWSDRNPSYTAKKHREKYREDPKRYADYWRKKKYGLPRGEYARMLEAQGGVCAICRRPAAGEPRAFAVDHCHDTNQIRGLLCNGCNTGIGGLQHDVEILKSAIRYLSAESP